MLNVLSPIRNPIGYLSVAVGVGAMCAAILIVTGWDSALVLAAAPDTAKEEFVILSPETTSATPTDFLPRYIEIINSCGPRFGEECVNARKGPSEEYSIRLRLRNGIVLRVGDIIETNGRTWYKIIFDEYVRYPERAYGDWYVASEYAVSFQTEGERILPESNNAADWKNSPQATSKRILIDRSEQMLYAYESLPAAPLGTAQAGERLFMQTPISTGLDLTPTPRGTFSVYKKTPSRYMQGPLPGISDQYYDLPGVPWNLYFTYQGGAIHGTYWHDSFGQVWSHGCVNLPTDSARKLYEWTPLGTPVIVQD